MTDMIDFDTGFFGRLRAAAGQDWTDYVDHAFVRQLGPGTLPEACFRRFLVQDYLFLVQFARCYGLMAYKSTSPADIRAASTGLTAILNELPLHVAYCAAWGFTEAGMAAEPEAAATMTYTRYVADVGNTGDVLDLAVALIPCVAGYAEIGQRVLRGPATVLDANPYGTWLKTYDGVEYKGSVRTALDKLDSLAARYGGEARFASLARIFVTATRLETAFWQMGLDAGLAEQSRVTLGELAS